MYKDITELEADIEAIIKKTPDFISDDLGAVFYRVLRRNGLEAARPKWSNKK